MLRLIAIEGLEGTGKTSVAKALVTALNEKGLPAIYAKQPGQALSGYCRQALLEHRPQPLSQLFLMLADRLENIKETIVPALRAGQWVIVDRYTDSTIAYQWFAANDPHLKSVFQDSFIEFERFVNQSQCELTPSLIFLLHASRAERLRRLSERDEDLRLGQNRDEFENRLQAYFLHTMPYLRGDRVHVIDTNASIAESVQCALKICIERSSACF